MKLDSSNDDFEKIKKGEYVYRYGQIIGITRCDIDIGMHVHSHNLESSAPVMRQFLAKCGEHVRILALKDL